MSTVITVRGKERKRAGCSAMERVKSFLPYAVGREIEEVIRGLGNDTVEEIRLRGGRRVSLTVGGIGGKRSLRLSYVCAQDELFSILTAMCDGSLYAYSESIIKGYISLEGGIRVGVCGRASVEEGKILGVRSISALNVRLPCGIMEADRLICGRIRAAAVKGEGTLVYSPPAQGKTTLLRSLAYSLSRDMRVALVDTREEFGGYFEGDGLFLDVLSGYPKAEGIRIATAFMSPELIICDEISPDEARAIAEAQNCGVPLLASTHGGDIDGLLRREGMRALYDAGVFGLYLGIRISYGRGFEYNLQDRREISFGDMGHNSHSV